MLLARKVLHKSVTSRLTLAATATVRPYYKDLGDVIAPGCVSGMTYLNSRRLNKGFSFTLEERQNFGFIGLLPACFRTQEEQMEVCRISFDLLHNPLDKYLYLSDLQERNERLFFRFVSQNIEEMMPIIYTPTVGLACQKFGLVYRRPRGLFITLHDKGQIFKILCNWPYSNVRAICVTNGEHIRGLGDFGAHSMGLPIGKLGLYTLLGGVQPHQCLPIQIDVGTDNEELRNDPLYVGLRQPRIKWDEFEPLMDEFMEGCVRRFGQQTLIEFENFALPDAFRFQSKYLNRYCMFNDDIQGTAAMTIAGLYASQRATKRKFSDCRILFVGAGQVGQGIARNCVKALQAEGMSQQEALDRIWMCDVDGLLSKCRPDIQEDPIRSEFAKEHSVLCDLNEIIQVIKPNVLIGASGAHGIFNATVLQSMAEFNERPIIFTLSFPADQSECTATEAYRHTEGRVLFSSAAQSDPVEYNHQTFCTAEANSAYIFPGMALAAISTRANHISDGMFFAAAKQLAAAVNDDDLAIGLLYPLKSQIPEISFAISVRVAEVAYDNGLAWNYPKPANIAEWLQGKLYSCCYESDMPKHWKYSTPPDGINVRKFKKLMSYTDGTKEF